jgi:hypothetical protein
MATSVAEARLLATSVANLSDAHKVDLDNNFIGCYVGLLFQL